MPLPYLILVMAQDSASQIKELEALLQEKTEELEAMKRKTIEFQNRLDRVSKVLPLLEK